MQYKTIGPDRTVIPAIGVGCMGVGGYLSADGTQDRKGISGLRLAFDLGMTFVDTAEGYGNGHSEELVGEAVAGMRDRVFIATKVSPEHLSHHDLIEACEASLRRLKTDHIDLYQIHWPNPAVPLEESMRAMHLLQQQGKIRHWGVSNVSVNQLREAVSAPPGRAAVAAQLEYNLFDRGIERDTLPFCEEEGISLMAYSPLNQGSLAFPPRQREVLTAVAEKHGKTPAQVALNWLIGHGPVLAIPKAGTPEHIMENAAAADFRLDPEDEAAIDAAFPTCPIKVPVDRIKVVLDGQGNRAAYQTLEDALANGLGFCPSPRELAAEIERLGDDIKPVRVRETRDLSGHYDYDLVEGRIRYWAWVIAHAGKEPIPVLVRG